MELIFAEFLCGNLSYGSNPGGKVFFRGEAAIRVASHADVLRLVTRSQVPTGFAAYEENAKIAQIRTRKIPFI